MRSFISLFIFLFGVFSYAGNDSGLPGIIGCGISEKLTDDCGNQFKSAKFISFSQDNIVFALKTNEDQSVVHKVSSEEDLEKSSPMVLDAVVESFDNNDTWVEI